MTGCTTSYRVPDLPCTVPDTVVGGCPAPLQVVTTIRRRLAMAHRRDGNGSRVGVMCRHSLGTFVRIWVYFSQI